MNEVLEIRMQTPGYGDVCFVCGEDASGFHGVPIWNGELVSNDWPGEWCGVPACEVCFRKHKEGRLPMLDSTFYWQRVFSHGYEAGDGI